ncbi:energy transducer TonB [Fluviicola sp.]|uniref:energy transducer TonB n=1 Tax=Fluviicola sp. TaxID=1917219 RepID=UPI0031D15BA7
MVLTLSIMAIIAAFSLYDYFSSKSWQMVTSKERNETVFENRNKEYGAYQIRRDYDKRILLVFLGVTVGIGALWGASTLFKPLEQRKPVETDLKAWTMDLTTKEEIPDIPEVVEQPAAAPSKAEIAEFRELVVSDTDQDNVTPPEGNKAIGNQAQTGEPGGDWDEPGFNLPGKGGSGAPIEIIKNVDPVTYVDEPAEFPGGMKALHEFIKDNIDLNIIDGNAKVYLKFVVDTDGTISSVSVTKTSEDCESCEKAAIKVVKSMPNWKPGKLNGKEVKSYYRLPINIQ